MDNQQQCDTCLGEGEIFQEGGAGPHRMIGNDWVECPDCNGDGEIYWEDGDDLHGGQCPTCKKEEHNG